MNRAYTPTRRDFSRSGAPLPEVISAFQASRVPNYAKGDVVTWDIGGGPQHGKVVAMHPGCTVILQGGPNGHVVRLAPDRPRKAETHERSI